MSQWTIGRKVAAGFLAVLAQALLVVVYALWITSQTSGKVELVSSEYLPESQLAAQIERDLLNARIHFIYFVTIQKPGSLDKGWQRFHSAQEVLPKLQDLVRRSDALAGLRPQVDQLARDFANYSPALEHIIDVVQRRQNQGPEFTALIAEWARLGGAMVDSAGQLSGHGSDATDTVSRSAASALSRARFMLMGLCLGGLALGLSLAFLVVRNIRGALGRVILALSESAKRVTGAAQQMAESAQSLSEGASRQAATLEETSASAEEISAMASKNADNANAATGKMSDASHQIDDANSNLEQLVESMNEITDSSAKISKIIHVIDEIAFQTNILALNAAVEAARAGEAGLGFAVVADEVRTLAQRCADAAKDTEALIEESARRSSDGKSKLGVVAATVVSITESADGVKLLVEEVKQGSEQEAQGIAQMARAMVEMDRVTQGIAASAAQSAAAGQELHTQAESLRGIVEGLKAIAGEQDRNGVQAQAAEDAGMFEWNSRFEFGIPEIDSQHKRLFALANRLYAALRRGESRDMMSDLLLDLLTYTETHFHDEEQMLKACQYPDFKNHKAQHDGLTRKVHRFADDLKAGRAAVSVELMTFLRDWLYDHILRTDTAYVGKLTASLAAHK